MIFELAKDYSDAIAAMPAGHPRRRMVELLEDAIRLLDAAARAALAGANVAGPDDVYFAAEMLRSSCDEED